jgi:hypothetical protein
MAPRYQLCKWTHAHGCMVPSTFGEPFLMENLEHISRLILDEVGNLHTNHPVFYIDNQKINAININIISDALRTNKTIIMMDENKDGFQFDCREI